MRQILFRGKRTDNGRWETGSLVVIRGGCSDEQIYIADKMTGYNTPVLEETVGQYTGLTDKNGTKIFEGDILKGFDYPYLNDKDFNYFAEVVWFDNCPAFGIYTLKNPKAKIRGISEGNTEFMEEWYSSQWEVIGNIHDKPELLGEPMKPAAKDIAQSGLAPATENFELLEG